MGSPLTQGKVKMHHKWIWALVAGLVIASTGCGQNTIKDAGVDQPVPNANSQTAQQNPVISATSGKWFISAANPYAVEAGASILARGGSAVDAAIATQAALGLVEPQSSGLGGGAFLLHFDPATGTLDAFDGREVAPASATPDRFLKPDGQPMEFYDAVVGGLSVGVPGVVRMLGMAHAEHGKLAWRDLFQPARLLAEEGFVVSPRLSQLLSRIPRLKQLPAAAAYFYTDDGAAIPAGSVLKNPAYASTLEILAEEGPHSFYQGPIAAAIVEAVNGAPNPGGMTLEDLAAYQPIRREAVCGAYRAYKVCSMPPPSSGGITLLQMLGILQKFDLAGARPGSIEALHLVFEASRIAYADRARYLADQDLSSIDGGLTIEEVIRGLLQPDYLASRAQLVDPAIAAPSVSAGNPAKFEGDPVVAAKWKEFGLDASGDGPSTSHFTIVDGEGRVVSMTTTVEFAFGSHLMAAGMVLNNQLTDFSFLPVQDGKPVANAVAPLKRPRSSMTPVIAFDEDGEIWAAVGSPGGPAIIGFVAKTLIGLVDWDMNMQEAIDLANFVYPRDSAVLEAEKFDSQIVAGLEQRGHRISQRELASGLHGFVVTAEGYDGGADARREGAWRTGDVIE